MHLAKKKVEILRQKKIAWKNRFVLDGSEVGMGILKKLEPHCGFLAENEEELGHGITVKGVNPRGGFVQAHIVKGDHLIVVDGHLIHGRDELEHYIHTKMAGDMVLIPFPFFHGLLYI